MDVLSEYILNEESVLLTGEYHVNGKLYARVIHGEETFLVDMRPLKIIDETMIGVGSNFKTGRKSARRLLGDVSMCPIKVNCNLGIWLFPTKSYNDDFCIWFSLMHVKGTKALGIRRTEVELSYGHKVIIQMKESAFNQRRKKAEELREKMTKNSKGSLTFFVESKKGIEMIEGEGVKRYTLN
ncbi:competence protein ComK [Mesobacillus subterraneus]|uniref:competence protein ComK n=1 Tax=Mesobacillus subterraneus TaxID=285983 RepID=UPI001CFDE4B6|nr:competence protein ComK [Mesobacillus subterraneus]WLR55441.1 competence protein ComK [Mesobacillus subterraneus]